MMLVLISWSDQYEDDDDECVNMLVKMVIMIMSRSDHPGIDDADEFGPINRLLWIL